MRKLIAVGCFLAMFSLAAMAQEGSYPKSEVFVGYQYTRLEGGLNANGWNFAANGNFNEWFGITGDFSGAYKSENGVSFHNYTYTFGPVISLRANKAFTPYVHALIGGDHASTVWQRLCHVGRRRSGPQLQPAHCLPCGPGRLDAASQFRIHQQQERSHLQRYRF